MVVRNNDLRQVDSGTIWLPPNASLANMAIPKLHETSLTKLYDLGTKFTYNDKVFRYCRADSGGILNPQYGAGNKNDIAISYTTLSYPDADATTVAAAVGATSVYVVKASATKDEYKGGHIVVGHNSDSTIQNRGILGNDAAATIAGVSNVVKIDLDFPLQTALVAGTSGVEVWKSIYSNVKKADTGYFGIVCVPCVYQATNAQEYFWGQTWGPAYLTAAATGYGASEGERTLTFNKEGALTDLYTQLHTNGFAFQIAGYLISHDQGDDLTFIMLTIAP